MAGERPTLPLEGVHILDFGTTVAGPAATKLLAMWGATVLRVESSVHPDTTRLGSPYAGDVRGLNRSGYFAVYNSDKRSLALNMQKPAAREFFKRLLPWADAVVETFVPGVMARWGLAYEDLRRVRPDLIMVSECLQGQTGPHATHRGYGQQASALTGWYEVTGWPDRPPTGPYSAYADFIALHYVSVAVLVALEYRRRTGRGQYVDLSQYEVACQFALPGLLGEQLPATRGAAAVRRGNRDPYAAPHGVFPCRGEDRWVAIAVRTDAQWSALCTEMGREDLCQNEGFATFLERKRHEDALEATLAAWTAGFEANDLVRRLQAVGVPAAAVAKGEDLFADPQFRFRGTFAVLDHPEMGRYRCHGSPFRFSDLVAQPRRAAPLLGEARDWVCREILGLSDDEMAAYEAAGIFE